MGVFDLVGTCAHTTHGYKHILTCNCHFSSHPNAILFKQVNRSVVNGMFDIFLALVSPLEVLYTTQVAPGFLYPSNPEKQLLLCYILRNNSQKLYGMEGSQ